MSAAPPSSPPAFPTVTVTIQIVCDPIISGTFSIFYSYLDPVSKVQIVSPTCDLVFGGPTYCNFQLDPSTSEADWKIVGLTPNAAPRSVRWQLKSDTSITTFDDDYQTHKFFLNFCNVQVLPGVYISDDPQEGNVPPPPTK